METVHDKFNIAAKKAVHSVHPIALECKADNYLNVIIDGEHLRAIPMETKDMDSSMAESIIKSVHDMFELFTVECFFDNPITI